MPDTLHLCLGRAGDLCIALPALKRWADQHGKPAPLLTSAEFMPMLEGCSYVKAAEFGQGTFHDLQGCLNFLKTDFPQVPVKCLQFYQSGDKPALPSFWHEQMYLAGLLGGGEEEPLVFDRRDRERECAMVSKTGKWDGHKPLILVATEGHSSPFRDADNLWALLSSEFQDECNVLDLSTVKAERIYDLLGLYDHAAALISIDTVHLHLSKASTVPVFALARDYPERWHGTPQLERFAWYCRYGQVMERSGELIDAIRDTLNGTPKPRPQFTISPKGAYNPSLIIHEGIPLTSVRYHPNRDWRTEIMLDGLPVRFPYPVSTCAHEDMRLFTFKGELWASYVCARGFKDDPRCVVGYGKLIRTPEFWAIEEHFQPDMPGNDWGGLCKNAVCFECNGKIHAIWDWTTILELDGNKWSARYTSCAAEWPYGEIRGGTSPIPVRIYHEYDSKGNYLHQLHHDDKRYWGLRFFHSRTWDQEAGKPWRYHIGALYMEMRPPFRVMQISKKPIISGDESGDPMIWHWKHGVVFVCGAVEDGDGWTISLGINDAHCALLHVKEEDLNL